jgi:hypothetical protein
VDAAHIHSVRHKALFLNLREPLKLDDKEFFSSLDAATPHSITSPRFSRSENPSCWLGSDRRRVHTGVWRTSSLNSVCRPARRRA